METKEIIVSGWFTEHTYRMPIKTMFDGDIAMALIGKNKCYVYDLELPMSEYKCVKFIIEA